jgi:hypothetical protein
VDLVWLGARTTANPFLVQEIADALKDTDIPVLVKNPVNPDLDLWIGALERLNRAGIKKQGVIHRGFSTFDKIQYRNDPQWQVAIELRSRYQERDRLQALFSDGIILSASYSKKDVGCDSGSRLAMNYAKEYHLPRFVMYDEQRDKDNPKYNLTRELIQDRGVSIVTPLNVETKVSNRLANTLYNPPIQLDIFN